MGYSTLSHPDPRVIPDYKTCQEENVEEEIRILLFLLKTTKIIIAFSVGQKVLPFLKNCKFHIVSHLWVSFQFLLSGSAKHFF